MTTLEKKWLEKASHSYTEFFNEYLAELAQTKEVAGQKLDTVKLTTEGIDCEENEVYARVFLKSTGEVPFTVEVECSYKPSHDYWDDVCVIERKVPKLLIDMDYSTGAIAKKFMNEAHTLFEKTNGELMRAFTHAALQVSKIELEA